VALWLSLGRVTELVDLFLSYAAFGVPYLYSFFSLPQKSSDLSSGDCIARAVAYCADTLGPVTNSDERHSSYRKTYPHVCADECLDRYMGGWDHWFNVKKAGTSFATNFKI
jgi:hypothetical protein